MDSNDKVDGDDQVASPQEYGMLPQKEDDDEEGEEWTKSLLSSSSNRNMSKSKGWTLQSSLLMLWMEKT